MSMILDLETIRRVLPNIDLLKIIEDGFVAFSEGRVVVPPVGELTFDDPPGEAHIKYGYIKDDDFYVIKIASGFYHNPRIGLPSSQGLMLLFSQKTGVCEAVLLDEGWLTDHRTAAAGAVAARLLAPREVRRIGILGAGTQARLQLQHLRAATSCRRAQVWVPAPDETEPFLQFFEDSDFEIEIAQNPAEVAGACNLIVTTTPSTEPLLQVSDISRGTHITAVGSDTAAKIELAPSILARADVVVADSLAQSESRGEVFRAVLSGDLKRDRVVELGTALADPSLARNDDGQITVCDLTGVAVQDIQIAKAVFAAVGKEETERLS
jgi:ornithine cyclodeaminase